LRIWRRRWDSIDDLILNSILLKFDIMELKKKESKLSEADIAYLKEGLKRTYTERFEMTTRLYKIHQTMSKATIIHKPFIQK
jgi:hypothetical protein